MVAIRFNDVSHRARSSSECVHWMRVLERYSLSQKLRDMKRIDLVVTLARKLELEFRQYELLDLNGETEKEWTPLPHWRL